ncbi:hypothetical protein N7478_009801 [Penicillium angulare]|uniref:uncharacterized protein n=1 Tax=Penicillium angulare TaxID=116970 RepID=UPI0025409DA7|nr:uncharacterized protein N7478_009801 [Penicillium angulare]KAJ5266993.1 hypothetical protein N7478_009801 [Penicillium angulare]
MPLPRGLTFATLAVLVILVVVVTALPGKELEVRAESTSGWDGTTALAKRSDRAAYTGNASILMSSVVGGACALAAINPGNTPVCVVAIAVAIIGVFVNLVAALASDPSKRSFSLDDDADGYYLYKYPSIDGAPRMFDQIQESFHAGDGLPIHFADTSCENNQTCHRLWYHKVEKQDSSGNDRVFHHIQSTPQNYDFRADSTNGTTGNHRRQAAHDADASVTSDSGTKIYGGYVFETRDLATDRDITGMKVHDVQQNVADQMSSEYDESKRFENYGIYCMDFDTTDDPSVGTVGYTWYYADHDSYPSGNEESFMNTCAEEAAGSA